MRIAGLVFVVLFASVTLAAAAVPDFLSPLSYSSGGYAPQSVVAADLNGDGRPDLVVANLCATSPICVGSVSILFSNGDGTFQAPVGYAVGSQEVPRSVAVIDVNHDNKLDIVVALDLASRTAGEVGVLLGNGDGTFQPMVTYSSGGGSPWSIATGDINGDGDPDLVVTNSSSDSVGVLLNHGDGTFEPVTVYASGGYSPRSALFADLNGDGKADLVMSNLCITELCNDHGLLGVMLGNGDGTFQPLATYVTGGQNATAVASADVNGDGRLDLLAVNICNDSIPVCGTTTGSVGVLLGNGNGTFQPAVPYLTDAGGRGIAVTDIDGDGKLDLVVAGNKTDVLLGSGDGTFQTSVATSVGSSLIDVADLNGDGLPDLVLSTGLTSSFLIAFNNSGTHTPTATTLASNNNPANLTQLVTYTARVTGQSPGTILGTVAFQDAGTPIAMVQLTGNQATFSARYSVVGAHSIAAIYSGGPHTSSGASSTLTERIVSPSKTVVKTSGSPSFIGKSVTFTATVTPGHGTVPNGEMVTFYNNNVAMGARAMVSGVATFTTSSLTAVAHTIRANYAGDSTIRSSSGTIKQVVQLYATATALHSSLNPSTPGAVVTFIATVTGTGPATPTGTVQFKSGTNNLGKPVALSGAAASFTTSTLAAGTHAITAQYLGDSVSAKSTSSVLNQVVQ